MKPKAHPNTLILASASPRRRELLGYFDRPFSVVPAPGPEIPPEGADAGRTVWDLSLAKARQVAQQYPGALVIGADTVVEIDGTILGKPRDEADARRMLRLLSGREHRVYTGVSLVRYGELPDATLFERTCVASTRVFFRDMTDAEIDAYVATGEPMDKAGAYGYQGRAGVFVERIDGDYFNVIGLPLCLLGKMLLEAGVKLF